MRESLGICSPVRVATTAPMTDLAIRQAAFAWLAEQKAIHGPVLPTRVLAEGFVFEGQRLPIMNRPRGIFRPRQCEFPLSVKTSLTSPYADCWTAEGSLLYSYQGTDPDHPNNAGLREAYRKQVPLVYFFAVVKGHYLAEFPIYVARDDPAQLTFELQLDDPATVTAPAASDMVEEPATGRRIYLTGSMRVRLHQAPFRERVLRAYRSQCAICRLRLRQLLDAAHIKPDSEGGEPVVSNGLALCKIHHTAFDRMFVGIRPDWTIQIHSEVLKAEDGPMLRYGLQQLHNRSLHVPRLARDQPDTSLLAARYAVFQQARLHL